MILDRLKDDMKEAMKSGDKIRLGVVRMLISELKNARIAVNKDLTEQDEEKVLASYAKKRKESIEKYLEGGRKDLADKEEKEHEITVSYLPEQLGQDELAAIIQKHIGELGASGKQDFGRVMKSVMAEVGSRAEGAKVSAMLREHLAG
jgi:uncharacterized protein YqeY